LAIPILKRIATDEMTSIQNLVRVLASNSKSEQVCKKNKYLVEVTV